MALPRSRPPLLVAILFGSFVGNLEAIMPNAAMATILHDLGASAASGTWVLTIYTLLFATSMPIFGALGDRIGHRRLYLWSLGAFAVATGGAGTAPSLTMLIIWRAVEGLAIAPALPSAMALIAR